MNQRRILYIYLKNDNQLIIHLINNQVEINHLVILIHNLTMYKLQYTKCAVDFYDVALPKYA